MSIIDFKEIPPAHGNGEAGLTDTFELFAQEFFKNLGFKILEGPSRGADNGKDLIIEETIQGKLDESESKVRWLVSCKHKAHSGNSVKPEDETHLSERLLTHQCDGFIGFYSTLASTGLDSFISGLRNRDHKTTVFNAQIIEANLLKTKSGIGLIERFFPESFNRWRAESPIRADIFRDDEFQLKCMVCDEDLVVNNKVNGNLYTIKPKNDLSKIIAFKWSCCGECDNRLNSNNHYQGIIEFFDHIESKATPVTFLLFMLDLINEMQKGITTLNDQALKDLRHFLFAIYPYVTRNMTTREAEVLDMELMMRSLV